MVLFKHHPFKNEAQVLAEGRQIYDDSRMVRDPLSRLARTSGFPGTGVLALGGSIPIPARRSRSPTPSASGTSTSSSRRTAAQTKSGTPLDYAPFLTEARRAELRAQNIYTVEQLAAIDGQELKNLGPGGRELKNNAAGVSRREPRPARRTLQMAAELEALRARNAVLEEDAKLEGASAPCRRRPTSSTT